MGPTKWRLLVPREAEVEEDEDDHWSIEDEHDDDPPSDEEIEAGWVEADEEGEEP